MSDNFDELMDGLCEDAGLEGLDEAQTLGKKVNIKLDLDQIRKFAANVEKELAKVKEGTPDNELVHRALLLAVRLLLDSRVLLLMIANEKWDTAEQLHSKLLSTIKKAKPALLQGSGLR